MVSIDMTLPIKITSIFVFIAVFAIGIFTASDIPNNNFFPKINAYSAECPSGMSDSECLEYLKEQAQKVSDEIGGLQDQLDSEKYDQLSFYEKINYKQALISQKEAEISELEIQIEKNNIEIQILLREIAILQGEIDVASQEVETLKNALQKRVRITYKYNRVSPLDIIFNADDFESMSRKIQYLQKTKEKDAELLSNMSNEIATLNSQKQDLAQKKIDVQSKRDSIEEDKTGIFTEQKTLIAERSTLATLLAESKAREQETLAQLTANTATQNALDAAIIETINKMVTEEDFASGDYIPAGGVVGYMGNTGYSTGAHLHFSYGGQPGYYCNGTINPWTSGYLIKGPEIWWTNPATGYNYYHLHSGSMILPAEPPALLSQTFHQGYAIDIWNPFVNDPTRNIRIYASHSGKILRYGNETTGKYAIIRNDTTGLTSCYLHLK
jgi:peptidoglycan hydrolase CwlO-like protein